jgi:tetratricopeptide (TPR) repeat protein
MRQKPLEPPDLHYMNAAQGWLGLGDLAAAKDELQNIEPELRNHPDVLEVRYGIYASAKHWQASLDVARMMIELAPERESGWYYSAESLYQLGRYQEAADTLAPVVKNFPLSAYLRYNLACFHCLLGRIKEARAVLDQAIQIGGRAMKLQAIHNPDLKPLWNKSAQV